MTATDYYLITSLPALGELGTPAPITPAQLLEHVQDSPGRALIETILLSDDLVQREALLAGEIDRVDPAVLTEAQLRGEQLLPAPLLVEATDSSARRVVVDSLWAAYFRHATEAARRHGGRFLGEWAAFEVALRNALAAERARVLGLEPAPYMVAVELASDDDLSTTVLEWSASANPLAGLHTLDRARWRWIGQHDRWFSFSDDELAAYSARLMLLRRWWRISQDAAEQPAAKTKNEGEK